MNKLKTFEDFLKEKCEEKGGFDGVLDDNYPEAFDRWLEGIDGSQLIEWGNTAVNEAILAGMDRAIYIIKNNPIT